MRSGRHYVQFTLLQSIIMMFFGVIQPGWDVEAGANAFNVNAHCFYETQDGSRYPGDHTWEGWRTRSRASASAYCSTSIRAA